MRLDANLKWLYTELPFEQRFAAAAEAGFEGVEYSSPYEYPADTVAGWLADAGLVQVLINTPAGPPDSPERAGYACLPGRRADFRAAVETALEYAGTLDAGLVHVMGGAVPEGVRPDAAFATLVDNLGWAAERAESSGVTLVLEAQNRRDVPGFVFDSLEHAASAVNAIGASNLGLMFDVYHCQVSQGDVVRRLEDLYPLIRHVQIADVPERNEPGTGELNWNRIFGTLRDLGYDSWIGCEYRPATETGAGLGWRAAYGLGPR